MVIFFFGQPYLKNINSTGTRKNLFKIIGKRPNKNSKKTTGKE
jgi:hypothetical protein